MTDKTSGPEQPDAALTALDRLVGRWRLSGEASGTVTYRWLPGGRFLIQDGELELFGHRNTFTEIIGREKPFGGEPSTDIKSRTYTSEGDTLDYVYDLDGDTLTIWGGHRGSESYYRGTLSADGNGRCDRTRAPAPGRQPRASRHGFAIAC
ncbi:MAG: hypothetical protein ACRDG7_12635 [Candidatus Limnocylindria bacterium]